MIIMLILYNNDYNNDYYVNSITWFTWSDFRRASTPKCRRRRPARRRRRTVVPIVALFVNTIVCRRLQVAAGCMQEVAACMQASCRLHAACIRSYAGGCRLQHPACRRLQDVAGCMQAACRLHAACMQPACISSGALALLNLHVLLAIAAYIEIVLILIYKMTLSFFAEINTTTTYYYSTCANSNAA